MTTQAPEERSVPFNPADAIRIVPLQVDAETLFRARLRSCGELHSWQRKLVLRGHQAVLCLGRTSSRLFAKQPPRP